MLPIWNFYLERSLSHADGDPVLRVRHRATIRSWARSADEGLTMRFAIAPLDRSTDAAGGLAPTVR
jgi:hypothetical protein